MCGACAGRVRAGVHIVSIQLRRKGSVTILSTVSCSDSKTSGRSGSTQGWVMTKGAPPAVVARKPASCRRFIRLTADIVPHRSFSRPRNSSHLVRVKRVRVEGSIEEGLGVGVGAGGRVGATVTVRGDRQRWAEPRGRTA